MVSAQSEVIARRVLEILANPEVSLSRGQGGMTECDLYLFQLGVTLVCQAHKGPALQSTVPHRLRQKTTFPHQFTGRHLGVAPTCISAQAVSITRQADEAAVGQVTRPVTAIETVE